MHRARLWRVWGRVVFLWLGILACNLPRAMTTATPPADLMATQTALVNLITLAAAQAQATPQPLATETFIASETQVSPTMISSPTPSPTVEHRMYPGEPPRAKQKIFDTISGQSAQQGVPNQPLAGDEYHWNLYERPFNAYAQDHYFPELDIVEGDITTDGTWLYVSIVLYGPALQRQEPAASYGLELDLDIDGRGEWLVWAHGPYPTEWTTDGVQVYHDADGDVGEVRACRDDPPQDGTSYEELVFDSGQGADPDVAWVRLVPGEKPQIQLSLKYTVIDRDTAFMWWIWADRGVNHPDWMDYHDHFTLEEAGEPFRVRKHYPIKAIAEVDNTCHWVFGFVPTGNEPCICLGEYATPTPTITPTPTPTIYYPTPKSGRVQGHLFKDRDGDKIYDAGEGVSGFTVDAHSGGCGGPVVGSGLSGADGSYTIDLPPGSYCIKPRTAVIWIPASYSISLNAGDIFSNLDFRYPTP